MANKFNSEGYYSPTEFKVFTKIEKEEAAVRKAASFVMRQAKMQKIKKFSFANGLNAW